VTEPFREPNVSYRLAMVRANVLAWTHRVWEDDPAYQEGSAGPDPEQDSPANYPYPDGDER
jgi:hypothetical protein